MRRAVRWLINSWGRNRAEDVGLAYRRRLPRGDPDTEAILRDLAKYCNVGATSFAPGDPHTTSFNEGARDVFNHVAEMLDLAPSDFPQLLKDHHDDD